MWQEHYQNGLKQLDKMQFAEAEHSFLQALACAKKDFKHTDTRIPDTFAFLGRSLLLQKKKEEAVPALRQAVAIAGHMQHRNKDIAITDYLWAFIDTSADAEKRKEKSLEELKAYLKPNEISNIVNTLARLFAAKANSETKPQDKPASEPSSSPAPESDSATESKSEPPQPSPIPHQPDQIPPNNPYQSGLFNSFLSYAEDLEPATPSSEIAPIGPQRYLDWTGRLSKALERAGQPELSELINAYVDLHNLMDETVQLYKTPHMAIADHLMGLADLANALGMLDRAGELTWLALRNYQLSLGAHPKTGYAHLALAQIFRAQENYSECRKHFNAARSLIQIQPNLDQKWFQQILESFAVVERNERMQAQLESNLEQIHRLCSEGNVEEADKLGLQSFKMLAECFPPDHHNFVSLFRAHSKALYRKNEVIAGRALDKIALYLESKLQDKYSHNLEMTQIFPPFSQSVLQHLYTKEITAEV